MVCPGEGIVAGIEIRCCLFCLQHGQIRGKGGVQRTAQLLLPVMPLHCRRDDLSGCMDTAVGSSGTDYRFFLPAQLPQCIFQFQLYGPGSALPLKP